MKYIHIGISLVIVLSACSCRTAKERSEKTQRDLTSENQESFMTWQYADSAGRYWHFQSDSLLFYHPDYGLYGQGGQLSVKEDEIRQNDFLQNSSSHNYYHDEQSEISEKVQPFARRKIGVWMVVVIAFVALIYGVKRRFFV